ncbi:hypothetical protein L810_1626 [Burkholderia sp. AU4i]|nr:hypothetical protein L810_1626 [Burkholderia sp. AU4i]
MRPDRHAGCGHASRSLPEGRIDGATLQGMFRGNTLARTTRDQRIDVVFKRARE